MKLAVPNFYGQFNFLQKKSQNVTAYGQDSLHKGMLKSIQNILWSTKNLQKANSPLLQEG